MRPLMIGYLRVSTEEQARSGFGLDAQRAAITAEADRRDWHLEFLADEGATGKTLNPGLLTALRRCATGQADGLVVAKMDRLARSVRHAADVLNAAQTQGWNLIVLDSGLDLTTPQGRAMAQMMAVFAELERELIATRTREALAARRAAGKPIGRPRLATAEVVRRIVLLRDAGTSYADIARTLGQEGFLSPAGRPAWEPSTVRRIYTSTKKLEVA